MAGARCAMLRATSYSRMAATISDSLRSGGALDMPRTLPLWLPDAAALAAAAAFLYVVFLFQGPTRLFHDADAGWHVRSGERMLRELRLPERDPYSFSRAGQPWIHWEWAPDVLAGAVHRAAGLGGVALLYSLAIAAAVWLWFEVQWKLGTGFLLACALAVPLLGTIQLHWLARPHIFSWLLMLAALRWVESKR